MREKSHCDISKKNIILGQDSSNVSHCSPIEPFCKICDKPEEAPPAADLPVLPLRRIRRRRIKHKFALKKPKKTAIRDFVLENPKKAKFYSGLTQWSHESLWNFLGPAKFELSILYSKHVSGKLKTMCVQSQFLLCLMILRRGYYYADIGFTFKLSKNTVAKIFKTWLIFLYVKFKDLQDTLFTRRCDLMKPLPDCFQNVLMKNVRVVVDCTEIQLQSVRNYKNQGNIYRYIFFAQLCVRNPTHFQCFFILSVITRNVPQQRF